MAVQFVIGRAGSGKSRRCFDRIVDALRADPLGPPAILWLLPKQSTFTAERELTCGAGLSGFCRARVLSLSQLGREVLAECGGSAVPEVTPLGRQMVLGHLLRTHQPHLRYFSAAAHQTGLTVELDATFAEFERCGKTAADLADLLGELDSAGDEDVQGRSLRDKLHDLHLLYNAYTVWLGQERIDPQRRLMQVLATLEECALLRDAEVYVDGFAEFTDNERKMLAGIARVCRRMEIMLLMDPASRVIHHPHTIPDELSLFHRTEQTYRQLWFTFNEEGLTIDEPLILEQIHRFRNPALAHIERGLFAGGPAAGTSSARVESIEAPDRRAEAEAAARQVNDLLRGGFRLRDIAVLVRDLGPYHELIHAAFAEHAIPCFIDRRRTAAHHPLLQLVRSALLITRHNWPHEAVMSIIKSGLAGLSPDEADELENYVLLHRIRGEAWTSAEPWTYRRTLWRDEEEEPTPVQRIELKHINNLRRRAADSLQPFVQELRPHRSKPGLTVRQIVIELFELLDRLDIRSTLIRWMEEATAGGRHEQRGEHQQVWAELVELFDQMVELMGEEQIGLDDFQDVLEAGLEQFDLALTPPTVDQVLIGQVDRARTPQVRAIILMGMNEGAFPLPPHEDSVLSDSERRTLRQRNIDIDPDTERRLLDENLLGYIAFTRASERLYILRSAADEAGRPLQPSIFIHRLKALFAGIQDQLVPRDTRHAPEHIGTPRQLVTSLAHWARQVAAEPAADPSAATWPALYQRLAIHPCGDDALALMRYRTWHALSYANRAALSPDVAGQLFPSPLHSSVTGIETFATCPFKHFLRYGLKLQPREEQDVTAMDMGNVFHQVLEKLIRAMLEQRRDWKDLSPQASDELIRTCAREVGQSLRGELMLSSARNQYLLQRIEKTLQQVIAAQRAAAERGGFRPLRAELGFGIEDAELPPFTLHTPEGAELRLYGKIDRVDLLADQAAFAVIDYKLTGRPLSLQNVYHGISLQLLTYLLVLQANGEKLAGRKLTPAAAFFVRLLRQLDNVGHPSEAAEPDDPLFHLQIKPRGIFDGRYLADIDSGCSAGRSEVVHAFLKNDGSFGHRNTMDTADGHEFAALLKHVEKCLGRLADQVVAGRIDISPYRINRASPCAWCDYHSVCRFDPVLNGYNHLPAMKREEVLEKVCREVGDG